MSKGALQFCYDVIKLILLGIMFILIYSSSFAVPNSEGIQIYQSNVHLSPEHKQRLADDVTRYKNAENLWDVLRQEFVLPHFENTEAVQQKIDWYMNNQDFLLRSASRAAPYLYYILQQVRKRHLPAELVLLPIVESGYNPFSLSSVGAAGIWQLMPGTASDLGIKQDWGYDGRRDVITSTHAALNYLVYLQNFFDGDWLRALAAYNTGEGNVLAAIKKNIREGRDTSFWSLPLAQQTRDYVPSLLALAVIISKPDVYPIYFPPVRNAPYLAQVNVGSKINLKHAAALAGISYQKLMQLNPGFNTQSTSTKGKLILPIENVDQFSENYARAAITPQINWLHYKVRSGDTLASISKKFSISLNQIKKMNHLSKNTLKPGTNLLLPSHEIITDDFSDEVVEKPKVSTSEKIIVAYKAKNSRNIVSVTENADANGEYKLQPGDTIYMVRANDTLEKIAKHFHVDSKTLQLANKLRSSYVQAGKELIIPTHPSLAINENQENHDNLLPGDTFYMVRRGDTIEKIAKKFHTSASAIRLNNLIDNDQLSEGQHLIIPTHIPIRG